MEKLERSVIEPRNPVLNVSRSANLPHVPGIRVGDYLFLSGMGPIDPVTGERRHGPIAERASFSVIGSRQRGAFDDHFHAVRQACAADGTRRRRIGKEFGIDLVHVRRFQHAVQQHVHLHHLIE